MPLRVITFGSLNVDHVYQVPRFAAPGETLSSTSYSRLAGGKGLNQTLALARAGASVMHAGQIGTDGLWLAEHLRGEGVDTQLILQSAETATGHAMIQVDPRGQNCIVLYGGANQLIPSEHCAAVAKHLNPQSILLLQNETNQLSAMLAAARPSGAKIAFNPAPMDANLEPLLMSDGITWLIVNEVEGAALAGGATDPQGIVAALRRSYPQTAVLLTLGDKGCIYCDSAERHEIPARKCDAVDTTAAGDTFIGYFLAAIAAGSSVRTGLERAAHAASICVGRAGAADSIPRAAELR